MIFTQSLSKSVFLKSKYMYLWYFFHLKHKPLLWIICVLSNSFSEEIWEQYYTLSSLLKSNILKPWLRFAVLEQMQVWEVGRCCQVVPEPTHSCHVAGLCLHRPTLSVSVSELMLISLCSKFLNCSCFFLILKYLFPLYWNMPEHFTWIFLLAKLSLNYLLGMKFSHCQMWVAVIVCLRMYVSVSFALTTFTSVLILELIFRRQDGLFLDLSLFWAMW